MSSLEDFERRFPDLYYLIAKGTVEEESDEPMYAAVIMRGDEEIGQGESPASAMMALQIAAVAAGLDWYLEMRHG
jgi:hypothetical protein